VTDTLHEDRYTFSITFHSVLPRIRSLTDTSCRQIQNMYFMFNTCFFENRAVDEIVLKIIVQTDKLQMAIWRVPFSYWMPKTTNTHSEYVILSVFPQQLMVIQTRCNIMLYGPSLCCY